MRQKGGSGLREVNRNDPCPCGSELKFKKCCGPALSGIVWPETPETLMRSRYSAFVTGDVRHLYRTTHPENEAVNGIDPAKFMSDTLGYCKQVDFTQLTVQQVSPPDENGVARVLFTALFRAAGQAGTFTELSDFVQVDGRWLYHSGKELDEPQPALPAPLVSQKQVPPAPGEPPTIRSR
ncbi:MAG TPA: YchJ family metal-binding protein [Symbiobacteriaceae bacterium]